MTEPDCPTVEIASDSVAINDYFYDQGMSDGLPVVPPTPARVEEMLGPLAGERARIIGSLAPRSQPVTIEQVAVNAVLAGCQPDYLSVVVAVTEAMVDPAFNLLGVQATTHPVSPLVVVNGPIASSLCINAGTGALGPGRKANATIGRAVRLVLQNLGGAYPGISDNATLGSPAKYSFLMAENEQASPWDSWHVELGYELASSTVTVIGCEGPHNLNDHAASCADELMQTICSTIATVGNNDVYLAGTPVLALSPEHAATLAASGWSKDDVRACVFADARVPMEAFNEPNRRRFAVKRPAYFGGTSPAPLVPLVDEPEDLMVIVAGGAGKHSAYFPTFGRTVRVTRQIAAT